MISTDLTRCIVAAISLLAFIEDAASLDQLPQKSGRPFLINLPDEKLDEIDKPVSPELKTPEKRSTTSVEIVKSIEVNLSDTESGNSGIPSSGSADLLFSDSDGIIRSNQNARQNSRNRSLRFRNLKASPSSRHNSNILPQDIKENRSNKDMPTDGLDFNSRILLGNILVRKSKEEFEDDEDKYSSYSEPKVASNKYHTTYINHNATATANKSRVNIKFPPKIFPIKSPTVQRSNKTILSYSQTPSKNQTQKLLYRSRFGKLSFQPRYSNKQNSTASVINTQNKFDKGQSVTHWDFGRKTTNETVDEEMISTSNSDDIYTDPPSSDITTLLPKFVHLTRSTTEPSRATTPQTVTENVINKAIVKPVLIQSSVPSRQPSPGVNQLVGVQGTAVLPSVSTIKVIPLYNQADLLKGTKVQPSVSSIKNSPGQRTAIIPLSNTIKVIPVYNTNTVQSTTVSPVNIIKSPQTYQVFYSQNGNVIRQDQGVIKRPQEQENIGQNVLKQEVRGTNINHGTEQIRPIYATNILKQHLGPQVFPNQDYRSVNLQDTNLRFPQRLHVGRLQSNQQDLRNWQPLYFVPHVPIHQQQQPAVPVVALHPVNTRSGTQSVPIFLQQQSSKSAEFVHPELYSTNVVARSALPSQDEVFYEGVVIGYPEDTEGEPSDVLPFLIS